MEYQEFVEAFRQILSDKSGIDREKITFEKEGGRLAEGGDRLLIEFADHEESTEICALHTEELYELYRGGKTEEELAQEVIRDIEEARGAQVYRKARELSDYEKIRGELFVRLINEERNRKSLEDAIYRTIGDIALVVYARMAENENGISSTKILGKFTEVWKKDREEIFTEALLNTYFINPPRIYRWEELIFDPDYGGENFMDLASEHSLVKTAMGNCLSTERKINGAVAVFLPGVAQRLYDLLDSDFYIVFTSIHEAMIHNVDTVRKEDLQEILNDITDRVTPKNEVLSSCIYRYSHDTKQFSCVSKGP